MSLIEKYEREREKLQEQFKFFRDPKEWMRKIDELNRKILELVMAGPEATLTESVSKFERYEGMFRKESENYTRVIKEYRESNRIRCGITKRYVATAKGRTLELADINNMFDITTFTDTKSVEKFLGYEPGKPRYFLILYFKEDVRNGKIGGVLPLYDPFRKRRFKTNIATIEINQFIMSKRNMKYPSFRAVDLPKFAKRDHPRHVINDLIHVFGSVTEIETLLNIK